MPSDHSDVPGNRVVNRVSDDSSEALFTSTLPADGIFGNRPSSPWNTQISSPTSPFQNMDMKVTSPFQNSDRRANAPLTDTSNGEAWRASFQNAGFVKPHFVPRPNPWGSPSDKPSPQPAPQPPADRTPPARPQPAPSNEPWDKAPNGPWNKPTEPSGGPWDKGPWGKDGGSSKPGTPVSDGGAVAAFQRDQVSRTSYTFRECVEKEKALGKENEVALEKQMRDWLGKQKDMNPIVHMRGTASLACALGEFRLEEGSRIDLASHQNEKPRILKGHDYDFGGEANTWLRMSAGSLVAAQQYVVGHKGLTIEGQSMDDAYLQQLKGLQTDVERKLDVIYGPHDLESVYSVVRDQVRTKSGDWQQGLVRLKYQLDDLKSSDNRFIAKSARDVALGFLAEADYMSSRDNGEEAKIMYQSANQYLAMSQRYDSSAPDNLALAKISERLKPQILKSIDNQWSDPFSNPFEIPKPAAMV